MLKRLLLCAALFAGTAVAAPTLDPELEILLPKLADDRELGVILTYHGDLTDADVSALEALGLSGIRMRELPMVAINARPDQIESLLATDRLRSIYRNAPLDFYLHQSRRTMRVEEMETDLALTRRNGGLPVSGKGVTVAVVDSGIDASHPDLEIDLLNPNFSKTIDNVQVTMSDQDGLIVRTDSLGPAPLAGIVTPVYAERQLNTDTHIGHGTHVAGIVAGTGEASGGLYRGIAPGAQLLGLGSGYGLFIVGAVASFDYILVHQTDMNIRVVNNSWGNSAVPPDPDHPVNVASRKLADRNIAVVMANGNDGPRPNSQSRFASFDWTFNIGAATKDGRLAGFSSRGLFGDPVLHPTLLLPGTGGPAAYDYTSAVVATRSSTNVVSTGLDADLELPPAHVARYTQISGTSMAAPHAAGLIASVVGANPALTVDEVKSILTRTATPLAVYDEFEAGAGLANAHAAVDLAFNPDKPYGDLGYTGKGLALTATSSTVIDGVLPSGGTRDHAFAIPPNTRFTFVQLDWAGVIGEDEIVFDNTQLVANELALAVIQDGRTVASSNAISLGGLFGARESIKLEFPTSGTATARVSAGLFQTVGDQPYRITVRHYTYAPAQIADLNDLPATQRTDALRLIYDRVLSADGGLLRPADVLTRLELGRGLMGAARVPQYYPDSPTYPDLAAGSSAALVAESLRAAGILGVGQVEFAPDAAIDRLALAVALVRALRLEDDARDLAGIAIEDDGNLITDNNAIPHELRGHVQLALDLDLLETLPAEIRQVAPGSFQVIPGPRFEPATDVTRGNAIAPLIRLLTLTFGEV